MPRLWDRHLLNSAVIAELVPPHARVADIGSGAGLPGIPIALARPDLAVTLVEPLLRRTRFLDLVVTTLPLPSVAVVRGRADEPHVLRSGPFDVVVARAVAPLRRLIPLCAPLLAPTGRLLAIKGATAGEELAAAADVLGSPEGVRVQEVGEFVVRPATSVVSIPWSAMTVTMRRGAP